MIKNRKNNSWFTSKQLWISLLISILFIFLETSRLPYFYEAKERVEGILYDFRLNSTLPKPVRTSQEHIVIVDIDEKSMQEQGRYPWSRTKVAELISILYDKGAVVIAFDIFFAEPERNPVDVILAELNKSSPDIADSLNEIKQTVDPDSAFARALAGSDVVLGFLLTDESEKSVGGALKSNVEWQSEQREKSEVTQYSGVISNIAQLQDASMGLGFINSRADADGFIRRAALVLRHKDQLYPSIALEAARLYTLADKVEANFVLDTGTDLSLFESVQIADRKVLTDEYGQILIPFKGPAYSFPYISATDVLKGRVTDEQLAGAVVFIGTSALGLADLRSTSVGLQYPGVEVHANVFDGLMNPGIVPSEPNWSSAYAILQMLLVGIILSFIMMHQSAITIALVGLATMVLTVSINFYFWYNLKISLPLFLPSFSIVVLSFYFIFVGFVTETNTKKNIQNMFGQYVPPEHIAKLMASPTGAEVKSERREMTVLFADIRSFTTLSESLTPAQLSEFLNEYLSSITEIIFRHGGTIDKYVGDMVMAFWNAPLDQPEHAKMGITTALDMLESLKTINTSFLEKGWPEVKLGIGLSTGEMNVGDMGSSYRKAYTVLGDIVNLGSRIESLTKFYGVELLVSEETKEQANDYVYRIIDKVTVVGKTEPVTIYEPISKRALDEASMEIIQQHNDAFTDFYHKDWHKAEAKFAILSKNTIFTTKVYEVMLERLQQMDINSLPDNWSGEFIHIKK